MQPIRITAVVDEKRRIMIDLPEEVEPGMVELDVTVRQVEGQIEENQSAAIDRAKAKLRAEGLLAEDHYPDALELGKDELKRIGEIFADERPISDLIDQDREERF